MQTGYDKESIYDEKIYPLMSQIIDICKAEGIPILAQFYLQSEDSSPNGKALYCITNLHVQGNTPEHMRKLAKAARNGF